MAGTTNSISTRNRLVGTLHSDNVFSGVVNTAFNPAYALVTETGAKINLYINSSDYKMHAELLNKNNEVIHISNIIDLPLETMVVDGRYDNETKEVVLILDNGNEVRFSVADLVEGLVSTDDLAEILGSYVTFEDFASEEKAGVIKTDLGQYGAQVSASTGVLSGRSINYNAYLSKGDNYFISKGTLENVITGKELVNQDDIEKYDEDLFGAETVSGSGSTIDLDNTTEGVMQKEFYGNLSQNTAILPNEYTQVDYIASDGNQYIDTGVNADINLDIKYEAENNVGNIIMGAIYDNGNQSYIRYHAGVNNDKFSFFILQNGTLATVSSDTNVKHSFYIQAKNRKVFVDETSFDLSANTGTDTNLNFWLFGRNSNSSNLENRAAFKMYSCKMYYNNVLVRDFIPCYRNNDNEVGLYDLVNDVFYTNLGTGAFTYGSALLIPTPDYPQNVEVATGLQEVNITGKNLFDSSFSDTTFSQTAISYEDDGTITLNGSVINGGATVLRSNLINKLTKGNYTLVFQYLSGTIANGAIRISMGNSNMVITQDTPDRYFSFAVPKDNTSNIAVRNTFNKDVEINKFGMYLNSNIVFTNYKFKLYIVRGTYTADEVPEYTSYTNDKYFINLGKNLFNKESYNSINAYIDASGVIKSSGGNKSVYIPCLPNTTYTVSRIQPTSGNNKFGVCCTSAVPEGDMQSEVYIRDNTADSITITTNETAKYLMVWCYVTDFIASLAETLSSIQVERGATATTYANYFTPIELCKYTMIIGGSDDPKTTRLYQDKIYKNDNKWYLEKTIEKKIVDGSEAWTLAQTNTNTLRFQNTTFLSDSIAAYGNKIITNLFVSSDPTDNADYEHVRNAIPNYSKYLFAVINKARLSDSTAAAFKTWLASNNIIVYYVLAEPVITEITNSELISELNSLYNAKSKDKQTNILIDGFLPIEMSAVAFTDSTKGKISNLDALVGDISKALDEIQGEVV